MRAWLDACTGKHVRYAVAIARELRAMGHDVFLTTREHPDTVRLAEALGERFVVVGRYAPGSREGKLMASIERTWGLAEAIRRLGRRPDVAICHQSVELCRVAFGLGIPIICTSDSPHAEAVGRLTIPLVSALVASRAIPRELFEALGARRVEQFNGVDELAWVGKQGLVAHDLPAEVADVDRPIIVVREEEYGASYARGRGLMARLAGELAKLGSVVFLPRYSRPARLPRGVVVPRGFVDGAALAREADLVISVGGTICREAALQGTPALVIRYLRAKLYVNDYLAKRGFPIFEVGPDDVLERAEELLGRKRDVGAILRELEDPVPLIVRLAEELSSGRAGQG